MPSDRQKSEWLKANSTEGWRDLFEYASITGSMRRCKVCGKTGYLEGGADPSPHSWAVGHLMGHSPCPVCGKQFTAGGMPLHIAKMHGGDGGDGRADDGPAADEEPGAWSRGGNGYPDRDSLMAAEANGWIVVSLFHDAQGSVAVYGPWPTQREARNARGRIRTRHRREFGEAVSYRIRPLWKESR